MASISPYGKRFISYIRQSQIRRLVGSGVRIDGRTPHQLRDVSIRTNVVNTADGSAEALLGKTRVVAGVKVGLGQPFPDTPDEGVLIVNAEILPHASPYSEIGPPDETAIELARVVDRGIRHSGFVDFKKLAIDQNKVYVLWVDLYVLNDDGNLVDAANLAALAALRSTMLPSAVKDEAGVKLDRNNKTALPSDLSKAPIAVSIGKIDSRIIVDPNLEEELSLDGRITITIAQDSIVSMQKTAGYFTEQELWQAVDLAYSIRDKLRDVLLKSLV
ncbi:exonuclease [Thermoproteus sp. CP80]|jgi:exosome complex component RRP42|uniref:exosome complex protein Rrp42 n=1 Tax=Thermoproteus sp. CP80 TaxID=1650659 RepID=UPI000749CCD4|nr:exosome complex protein Rrp42 [Thermoproteus sp. CP80]KUO84390.1 MAG: exonuclease [Thermoproteus sp. CIS_19]KUO87674.1 MAG: exonuclease [Thermoproteus sp. JCHS_4]MCI4464508.1 exosome complex protein Rrp42 [Thermoproteus sp.]MDT7881772.1 exosome complex protein Rrp42 [Thermoproteus sp.]PLC64840.1 exonuclease [Thermoproteus sp. CP80]